MSRRPLIITQVVIALLVLCAPARLKASSGTAYVSICCNAPSTTDVFDASTLTQSRTIVTGSGGDAIALIQVDQPLTFDVIDKICGLPHTIKVRALSF